MGLQTSFNVLSEVVEQYESRGRSVRDVEARTGEGDALHVTLDVPVSVCAASGGLGGDATPATATLTDEGDLRVEFETSVREALRPPTAAAVDATERTARVTDDGVALTVDLTIDPAAAERTGTREAATGARAASAPAGDESASGDGPDADADGAEDAAESTRAAPGEDDLATARDESVPLYEDTEYLRRLYEACDTFAEMSRRISMEVSSETVRRYTIEAGIHDPTSYDTAAGEAGGADADGSEDADAATGSGDDDPAESVASGHAESDPAEPTTTQSPGDDPRETLSDEQLITDGIGLPADLRIEDVADAVVESMTIYEVHQRLGIGQMETRDLLKQLNLLDLVMHRMGDDPERAATYDQVAARIRQCAPEGADPAEPA